MPAIKPPSESSDINLLLFIANHHRAEIFKSVLDEDEKWKLVVEIIDFIKEYNTFMIENLLKATSLWDEKAEVEEFLDVFVKAERLIHQKGGAYIFYGSSH